MTLNPVLAFVSQGTHTAMKSGMLAAEATFEALQEDTVRTGDISAYQQVRSQGDYIDEFGRCDNSARIKDWRYRKRETQAI